MQASNEMIHRSILCVQDDADARDIINETLREQRLVFASTAFEAVRAVYNDVFDAYILDYWLRGWSGVQLCRGIRRADPHGPVLFCTTATHERERQQAVRAGATAYICKRADPQALRTRLDVLNTLTARESRAARTYIPTPIIRHLTDLYAGTRTGRTRKGA